MGKHRWQSYRYVQAWFKLQGCFEYDQRVRMQRAALEGAPLDAVHPDPCNQGWPGKWTTLDQLSPEDRKRVEEASAQ